MPIPLILLGAAALAGGFGVKKGVDAKSLFKRLKTEHLQTQQRYESAVKELEKAVNSTQITFEVLGNQNIELYKNSLIPFVEAFSLIKNVDFNDGSIFAEGSLSVTQTDMLALLDVSLTMKDVITTGVGCLGGGGLTALAASGVNGLFGAVSAGSAFSSAAGTAAANSAAASMGGGALTAGACAGGGSLAGAGCMAGAAGGMAGAAGGMAGGMGMGAGAGAMAGAAGGMGMGAGAGGMAGAAGGMGLGGGAGGMGLGGGAGAMAGAAGGMGMGGGAGAMAGAGGMGMCGGAGALAGAAGTAGGIGGGVVSSVAGGVAGGTVGAVSGGATVSSAAGVAALGGMVAGPFLAVGGMVLASKAKQASADAATNLKRVDAAVELMKSRQLATEAVFYRVYTILSLLGRLDERFVPLVAEVQRLVVVSHDYTTYNDKDKKSVMMAAMMAKTLKNVMETSLLDDNGMITSASEQIVAESERFMEAIAL